MKQNLLPRLCAIVLGLSLSVLFLAGVINLAGTEPGTMLLLFEDCAPPADTRLPAEEYPAVAEMIAVYLKGERDTFQHIFIADGAEYAAFNAKEQHHMADVQALFVLCRHVMTGASVLAAAMLVMLALMWRPRAALWLRRTLLSVLAGAALLTLLAVIDFDSLFVLFHKVAFTNDLWLLNPQTDLLIRLMPIEFFISCAILIGLGWTLMMSLCILLTFLLQRLRKKGNTP